MSNLKKILIVEDEEAVRRVLRDALNTDGGFKITEAENGEEALTLATREYPDLVILDLLMPKMHGMDMLDKLRDEDWGKEIPIILLTNYADDPRVTDLIQDDRIELVDKTKLKLDDLIETIHKLLGAS